MNPPIPFLDLELLGSSMNPALIFGNSSKDGRSDEDKELEVLEQEILAEMKGITNKHKKLIPIGGTFPDKKKAVPEGNVKFEMTDDSSSDDSDDSSSDSEDSSEPEGRLVIDEGRGVQTDGSLVGAGGVGAEEEGNLVIDEGEEGNLIINEGEEENLVIDEGNLVIDEPEEGNLIIDEETVVEDGEFVLPELETRYFWI